MAPETAGPLDALTDGTSWAGQPPGERRKWVTWGSATWCLPAAGAMLPEPDKLATLEASGKRPDFPAKSRQAG
jgi:hypothetical protein